MNEKELKYHLDYQKKRRLSDENYKIRRYLTSNLWHLIKYGNNKKMLSLIGCSLTKLKSHLEKQFVSEMDWNNYGSVWSIDHIMPCISFNLTKLNHQKYCYNYKNLRPILSINNKSKKDKLELIF